ncbi:MAG: M28 family peptidase [Fibrobacterota bacterium]
MAPSLFDQRFHDIFSAYSGTNAKALTARLYRHNRLITHPAYQAAARQCAALMKKEGFDRVEVLKFPIDGKRCYGNWRTPKFWDIKRAYLKIKVAGKWRTFADTRKVPTSVFVYAAPTQGEVSTLLVSMESQAIAGKMVFCPPTDENRLKLEKAGSLGMVSDFAPDWEGVRGPSDFRTGHRWENGVFSDSERPMPGFSLSRDQGAALRKALEREGALECLYRIDGTLGQGDFLCVTGCLTGTELPDEEVVVPAHLYECGANDNCSGVAAAMEALRAIRILVKKKKIAQPRRTLRVLFAFEVVGFLAYFEKRLKEKKHTVYIAGVNPDMVGQDQKKCRSVLNLYTSPHANTTFADPLLFEFIKRAAGDQLQWARKGFIVNDNVISDPVIGVPCPALIHLRDQFYHSNLDDMTKVSADTLKRVGGAMAAYLYAAAMLASDTAEPVAALCLAYAHERLTEEAEKGLSPERRDYLLDRETERLASVERAAGTALPGPRAALLEFGRGLKVAPSQPVALPAGFSEKAKALIPVRTVAGTFTLEHIPYEQRRTLRFQPHWSVKWNLPVFWADGRRTLLDIYRLASFESGPYAPEEFLDYFLFLE